MSPIPVQALPEYLSGAYAKGRIVELVDLPRAIDIDTFDRMLRAVDAVLAASESLSLDQPADRERLRERLVVALGAVPDRGASRVLKPRRFR